MCNIQDSNSVVQFKNEHHRLFFIKSWQLLSTASMILDLISVQITGTRIGFCCKRKCLCTDCGEYDIGEINTHVKTMFFAHEEETLIMYGHMQSLDQSFTVFTHHIPCICSLHLRRKLILRWDERHRRVDDDKGKISWTTYSVCSVKQNLNNTKQVIPQYVTLHSHLDNPTFLF